MTFEYAELEEPFINLFDDPTETAPLFRVDPVVELRGLIVDILKAKNGDYRHLFGQVGNILDENPCVVHHPCFSGIRLPAALRAINDMQHAPTDTVYTPISAEMIVLVEKWYSAHRHVANAESHRYIRAHLLLNFPLYCREHHNLPFSVAGWLEHQRLQHDPSTLEYQLVSAVATCKQDDPTVLPRLEQNGLISRTSEVLRYLQIPRALDCYSTQIDSIECMRVLWPHSSTSFCTAMASNHPLYCAACQTVCSNLSTLHSHACVT